MAFFGKTDGQGNGRAPPAPMVAGAFHLAMKGGAE